MTIVTDKTEAPLLEVHTLKVSINLNPPPSDEGGGFCVAKDGGRENALIKSFLTTPQSASQTATYCGRPLCHFVTSPHNVGSHP